MNRSIPKLQKLLNHKEEIIEKRNSGATYVQLAKDYNVSPSTVGTFMKRYGLNGYGAQNFKPGQIFKKSNLEIVERDYNPPFTGHETAYKCKCLSCGEIKTYRKSTIESGYGCLKCSDLQWGRNYCTWNIGDKFGFLTIVGKGENSKAKCQCVCGAIKDIDVSKLKCGETISCGCKSISSGELKVLQILNEYHIKNKREYIISDFNSRARFDFAIFDDNNNLIKLIEYDGEQHYHPIEVWGGEKQFKIQQERDNQKNTYCKEHNIPLLRIPYWNYNKIDIQYLFPNFPKID